MTQYKRPPWIQTFSGKAIDIERPRLSTLSIEDVAHALARINRFTGHSRNPISVAQHSVLVSELCPDKFKYEGLMHDVHECVLGDISTPVKRFLGPRVRRLEAFLMAAFARRFRIPYPTSVEVGMCDLEALMIEKRDAFAGQVQEREWDFPESTSDLLVAPMDPHSAETIFLYHFEQLVPKGVAR